MVAPVSKEPVNRLISKFGAWNLANLLYGLHLVICYNWLFHHLNLWRPSVIVCVAKYCKNHEKSERLGRLRKWRHTPTCLMARCYFFAHLKPKNLPLFWYQKECWALYSFSSADPFPFIVERPTYVLINIHECSSYTIC